VTDIAFHFNVPNKLAYACRLLRKGVASGAKIVVTGPGEALQSLDADLWDVSPTDFLPHCGQAATASVIDKSPIVLVQTLQSVPHHEVLINLDTHVPPGFDSFQRVIEIVTHDDADKLEARLRWKHYAKAGLTLTRHDLDLKA
jgi:DNA polymerase-3 subunit chi